MKEPIRICGVAAMAFAAASVIAPFSSAFADASRRPMALVIMVDGMRADAVETQNMPNLARLRNGTWAPGYSTAWSLDGQVVDSTSLRKTIPSSGPNHASIATGVTPQRHRVTTNDNMGGGDFATYPTWLKRVIDANPGAAALFAYTWATDAALGPADGVTFLAGTDAGNATAVATRLASANAPDATMYFIDGPDAAGHAHNFFPMSAEYKAALATADGYIGQCLTAITGRATFAQEDWLVVVTSDHGGYRNMYGQVIYGRQADTVPVVISGRNVAPGRIPGLPRNYDVTASALAHFGVSAAGLDATRRDLATSVDAARELSDGLVAYLPFDTSTTANAAPGSSIAPTAGGSATIASGGAIGSYCSFPNSTGNYVKLDGTDSASLSYEGGKCLAVTFWMRIARPVNGDPAIVANKKWTGAAKGVLLFGGYNKLNDHCGLSGYNSSVGLHMSDGGSHAINNRLDMGPFDYEDDASAWMFFAFTRNADGAITLYQGRSDGTLDWISGEFSGFSLESGYPFYIGNDTTGNYSKPFVGGIDDFGLWTRALTHAEIRRIYESGRAGTALGGLLASGPATATWTGAVSSDPANAANWSGNALPSTGTAVTVSGTPAHAPNFADGRDLPCASLFFNNVVLTGDACLRGVAASKIASGSSVDLNGHVLTLSAASSAPTLAVSDSSSGAPGEFRLFVGGTLANSATTFSGNVRFVKEGAGTYTAGASESYSGGIAVLGGTYKLSNYATGDICIGYGATFDQFGYSLKDNPVVLAGGTLTNTKGSNSVLPSSLDLTADSTIAYGSNVTFDWGVPKNSVWNLGGKTLNLVMDGGDPDFNMAEGETISNGTFKVTVKASSCNNTGKAWVAFAALDGRNGLNLDLGTSILRLKHCSPNRNSSVFDFTCNPLAGQTVYSGNQLEVYGTFKAQSTDGFNLLMMDGSTMDLSSRSGVWNCAFSNSGGYAGGSDTGCKVAFDDGATVTVNLSGRADLPTIASEHGYVVTWAANAVPDASTTFVIDDASAALGYKLRKNSTGLKLSKWTGLMMIMR